MRLKHSLALASFVILSCGHEDARVAGNGTNIGNAQAAGRILAPDGAPAEGVWIECSPDSLHPWDPRLPGWTSLTDSDGRYRCTDLPRGRVGVSARDPGTGLTRWRADTISVRAPASEAVDTLAPSGKLRVALPPGTSGTLHFTGLTRSFPVRGELEVLIEDIPAGWSGSLLLARSATSSSIVDSELNVLPGAVDSAGFTRRVATIIVPLAGAATAALTDLPLLVRLDSSWSGFAASLPDGSDLRVASTSGEALPLTLVEWDREARRGVFWTMLDSVPAPADSVALRLSWGIPVPTTTPAAAFAASRGWTAVWPLGDTSKVVSDRLGLHPGIATSLASTPGVFGRASRFDGSRSMATIANSNSGTLALPEGGPYTLSCWVRLATFGTSRFVAGHGELGSHIKFQSTYGKDTNSWLAKEFRDAPAGGHYRLGKADTAKWTHLAMTVSDTTILYVDGARQMLATGFDGSDVGRRDVPFAIGAALDTLGGSARHFHGEIQEVWLQSVARSPDWLRIVAANQKSAAPRAREAKQPISVVP